MTVSERIDVIHKAQRKLILVCFTGGTILFWVGYWFGAHHVC